MIVIGIDPGSRYTGIGIVSYTNNQPRYLYSARVRCTPKATLGQRLVEIDQCLMEVIQTYQPTTAAIESVFYAKNANTALVLGHARGIALMRLHQHCGSVHEYAPRLIKQTITGTGNANKTQVQFMCKHLLNINRPLSEDAADGLAIALCHIHHHKESKL